MPRWLLWTLLAIACWGVWAVIPLEVGNALTTPQQQALSTFGLLPLVAVLAFQKAPREADAKRRGVGISALAGTCSALGNIPFLVLLASGAKAATVVPLTAMYPLVTVTLAVTLLRERLNVVQAIGFVVSMCAIYLLNGATAALSGWLLVASLAIVLFGVAGLLQKMATSYVSAGYAAFWFHLAFVPVGAILYFIDPLTSAPSARVWGLIVLWGFTLALGNLAVLAAFSHGGRAAIITPMAGLYPLISLPIALWRFGERIDGREAVGIFLALLAVGLLTYEYPVAATAHAQPATDPLA